MAMGQHIAYSFGGVNLVSITPMEKASYLDNLKGQGWTQIGSAFEAPLDLPVAQLRQTACKYGSEIGADMLVEVEDPLLSKNNYNNLVFYPWRMIESPDAGGYAYQQSGYPPEDPYSSSGGYGAGMAGGQLPTYDTPKPRGGICSRCNTNSLEFYDDGSGACMGCGRMFMWKGDPDPLNPFMDSGGADTDQYSEGVGAYQEPSFDEGSEEEMASTRKKERTKPKEEQKSLTIDEKLDLLDERLLRGDISEKNYELLREKLMKIKAEEDRKRPLTPAEKIALAKVSLKEGKISESTYNQIIEKYGEKPIERVADKKEKVQTEEPSTHEDLPPVTPPSKDLKIDFNLPIGTAERVQEKSAREGKPRAEITPPITTGSLAASETSSKVPSSPLAPGEGQPVQTGKAITADTKPKEPTIPRSSEDKAQTPASPPVDAAKVQAPASPPVDAAKVQAPASPPVDTAKAQTPASPTPAATATQVARGKPTNHSHTHPSNAFERTCNTYTSKGPHPLSICGPTTDTYSNCKRCCQSNTKETHQRNMLAMQLQKTHVL